MIPYFLSFSPLLEQMRDFSVAGQFVADAIRVDVAHLICHTSREYDISRLEQLPHVDRLGVLTLSIDKFARNFGFARCTFRFTESGSGREVIKIGINNFKWAWCAVHAMLPQEEKGDGLATRVADGCLNDLRILWIAG